MMNVRRSRVSLALSAVLTGGAVAAVPGIASAGIGAPAGINPNGTGSALVFPYYTANGGWSTLFNITNTSEDFLAVKVRFREQENSRDVLDFNLVMSPKDVWTGWVADGPNGPRFKTKDSSCTSPILNEGSDGARYADFSSEAYTGGSNDGGSTGIARAAEGHLEVFVMGQLRKSQVSKDTPTAYYADHAHLDCDMVDAGFEVGPGANEPSESYTGVDPSHQNPISGDPRARDDFDMLPYNGVGSCGPYDTFPYDCYHGYYAPLKGNVSFINTGRGVGAGSTALHIEGFGAGYNLVTAQEYPYFLEPTLASNSGLWRWWIPGEIGAGKVINEWSVNEKVGARTDWIVAFPEKYLHVDIYDDLQAGVNLVRLADAFGDGYCQSVGSKYQCGSSTSADTLAGALANDQPSLSSILDPFSEPFDKQSCDEVVYDLYDREENGVQGTGTSISPAPAVPPESLCYETNVITFGGAPSVLDSRLALTIDTSGLTSGASAGWMDLQLSSGPMMYCAITGPWDDPRFCPSQKPVAGFALKERDFGDPNKNYGQLMDHGYGNNGRIAPP